MRGSRRCGRPRRFPRPAMPRSRRVTGRSGDACVSGFRSFLARTCSWGCRWSPSLRQVSERRPSSPDRRTHSYGPITARRSPLPAHRKATVTGTDPLDRSPRRAHTAPNPRTTTAILARDLMTLHRNRRRTRAATEDATGAVTAGDANAGRCGDDGGSSSSPSHGSDH